MDSCRIEPNQSKNSWDTFESFLNFWTPRFRPNISKKKRRNAVISCPISLSFCFQLSIFNSQTRGADSLREKIPLGGSQSIGETILKKKLNICFNYLKKNCVLLVQSQVYTKKKKKLSQNKPKLWVAHNLI